MRTRIAASNSRGVRSAHPDAARAAQRLLARRSCGPLVAEAALTPLAYVQAGEMQPSPHRLATLGGRESTIGVS